MTDLAYLICSGGSASKVLPIPDDAHVTCVNGSYKVIEPRLPDAYVIGEIHATKMYRDVCKRFNEAGVKNLCRERCIARGMHGGTAIPYDYGPKFLHHLHEDWRGPVPQPRSGEHPVNARPWMGSGVLALWWILHDLRPEKLIVAGLDGYPPDTSKGLEYDPAIKPLEKRPFRTEEWCNVQNWWTACAIWALTNYYTETEIHWAQFPNRFGSCPNWRVHWLERGRPKKPGTVDGTPGIADREAK